jgi:hypothetical protein
MLACGVTLFPTRRPIPQTAIDTYIGLEGRAPRSDL